MKLKYILAISPILFFSLFHFQTLNAQQAQYRVVPLPQSIEETNAEPFRLSATTSIQCGVNDEMMRRNAAFLSEYVEKATGWKLSLNEAKKRLKQDVITLRLNPSIKEAEGYRIIVNKKSIVIEGQTPNGVFYGIQTLRKSLPIISKS
ncbi:MAG: glycoside hydrolase family 20 zincin-like fold domain-containing protein, partial [Bacteroidaceae bacterium]|nr:glycoside hydrolase family 20 zincin-like fold domain-containing protein [Bacteroidaceae bacterium]